MLGAGLLLGLALAGCAETGSGSRGSAGAEDWEAFGPFERPDSSVDAPGLPGPARLLVPDVGEVRLDAAELLDGQRVDSQVFTYTFDEQTPMIAAIVQYTEEGPGGSAQHVTQVLGVSAEREPRVTTRTNVYAGAPHSAELAGTSDLGVVAVFLEGELREEEGVMQQLAGVDAARGTWVWAKEDGYPVYGEGTAVFYAADSRDACAARVEEYAVGSGAVRETRAIDGQECLRLDPGRTE